MEYFSLSQKILGKYAVMCVLDQNNKYGIRDSGLLVESDVSEHPQRYGAESDLNCSSTAKVKDPFKYFFLYSCPLIFVLSPPSRAGLLKNRLHISSCIPQMVIVVSYLREVFVIYNVPDRTHVFVCPNSPL